MSDSDEHHRAVVVVLLEEVERLKQELATAQQPGVRPLSTAQTAPAVQPENDPENDKSTPAVTSGDESSDSPSQTEVGPVPTTLEAALGTSYQKRPAPNVVKVFSVDALSAVKDWPEDMKALGLEELRKKTQDGSYVVQISRGDSVLGFAKLWVSNKSDSAKKFSVELPGQFSASLKEDCQIKPREGLSLQFRDSRNVPQARKVYYNVLHGDDNSHADMETHEVPVKGGKPGETHTVNYYKVRMKEGKRGNRIEVTETEIQQELLSEHVVCPKQQLAFGQPAQRYRIEISSWKTLGKKSEDDLPFRFQIEDGQVITKLVGNAQASSGSSGISGWFSKKWADRNKKTARNVNAPTGPQGQQTDAALLSESSVPQDPQVDAFASIGGLQQELNKITMAFFDDDSDERPSGLLMYGPPGNGKTLLAQCFKEYLSSHLKKDFDFQVINGSEYMTKYVGEAEKKIKEIFDNAEAREGGTVLFIDEIDALAPNRDGAGITAVERRPVSVLLTQMDGFKTKGQANKVILIAATNRKDALDPALLRPGRFDSHIEISNRKRRRGRGWA
jgi:hypothetical protein